MNMRDQLAVWRDKLDAYAYMLDQREVNRATQMQAIARRNLGRQLAVLQAKRDALAMRLQKIESKRDYFALIEGEKKEFLDIVLKMEQTIAQLQRAGEPVDNFTEQLRRYKGILWWEGSEAFADKIWELRSAVNALDRALTDTRENLTRLNRVIVEAPDIEPYRARMALLNNRLNYESGRVNAAATLAENTLRGKVSDELVRQKRHLQHYQSQARLSVARLYDTALLGVDE